MFPYDMLLVPYIVCLLKPIKIFLIVYRVGNKTVKSEYLKIFAKNIKKMFASIKKSCTFVLGLSKEVLSPINLLVISFSVINYVVRVRVHARCVDAHFFCIYPIFRYVWSLRLAQRPKYSGHRACLSD